MTAARPHAHELADRRRRRATASSRRRSRGPGGRRARRPRADLRAPARAGTPRATARAAARCAPSSPPAAPCRSPAVACPGAASTGRRAPSSAPARSTTRSVFANARSSSPGKPTITSVVRLKSVERARAGAGTWRPCSAGPSRAGRRRRRTGAGRAGGATTVGVSRSAHELARRHVVDLDRGEPQPREPGRRARLADRAAAAS